MSVYCAIITVILLGVTGTLCLNNISPMATGLPQCEEVICNDTPSIVDILSFNNGTVVITFSEPRGCSKPISKYVTTYGCSQQVGVINQSMTINTSDSENLQKINLLTAEEIAASQDWECAFVVQGIIQPPMDAEDTSCITDRSSCTVINVSSYASHHSTSLERNCMLISACPGISQSVPVFALSFCSTQRPIIESPHDIRQNLVPYLSIVRDNDAGSEEVCVNETYSNLTIVTAQCAEADVLLNANPTTCLRLRARLSLTNSSCGHMNLSPSTCPDSTKTDNTMVSEETNNYKTLAISSTILWPLFLVLFVASVLSFVCYIKCHHRQTEGDNSSISSNKQSYELTNK